jgi:uridine kinase
MLPVCIRQRHLAKDAWVFLLDGQVRRRSISRSQTDLIVQIGTGATAFMAIRVLLDHGVRQDRIIFVTFLVARGGGISVLRRAFPDVKIVCGAVDDRMQETWLEGPNADGHAQGQGRKAWIMQPGMGQIGEHFPFPNSRRSDIMLYAGDLYYL